MSAGAALPARMPALRKVPLKQAKPQHSPAHQAWITRKRRERAGLPLRRRDREQITQQLEDL